ncbi:hypothetical protein N182_34280 [Sinorhizobium sp. GL2]|nr:hypothetical protein N182_34280 [Sinorhizobium sp. GL2]
MLGAVSAPFVGAPVISGDADKFALDAYAS